MPIAWSGRPEEFHLQSPSGRVEGWRGSRKPVSSPRLVKRSMRISRTTLSLLTSSEGLWGLSNWQRFRPYPSLTPPVPAESVFTFRYIFLLRSCRLMDAFIISSLPPSVVGRLLTAGSLCSRTLLRIIAVESEEVEPSSPSSVRSIKRLVQFSRKPLSFAAPHPESP